jgi:organic radical activating enzyme
MDFTPGKPLRAYAEDGTWRDFSTDELVGQKLNGFLDWQCGYGVDSIFVNPDGVIYGATCKAGGILGNIYEDFELPISWQRCPQQLCTCGSDLFIPKARTHSQAALLRRSQDLPTQAPLRDDTLQHMVALERTHAANQKQVYWEIGRRCNYDCSYCHPIIHNMTDRHKTLDELLTATKKVQAKFIGTARCNWIISGGEPTANPALLDWCRYINSFGYKLSMHSNGSRKPDYYQELIKYGDLNLSAHYEFWRTEHFLDVIRAITDTKVAAQNQGVGHLEVKLMMKPGTGDQTLDFEARMRAIPEFVNYCTWAVVPVRLHSSEVMPGYSNSETAMFGDRR